MPCSVCIELEQSLKSALELQYPSVNGTTEAGKLSREQSKQERLSRIGNLLLQHCGRRGRARM